MGNGISVIAPAKVNLFLDIGKKRGDGFHDLVTVMQKISLCDRIDIETGRGRAGETGPCRAAVLSPAAERRPRSAARAAPRIAQAWLT